MDHACLVRTCRKLIESWTWTPFPSRAKVRVHSATSPAKKWCGTKWSEVQASMWLAKYQGRLQQRVQRTGCLGSFMHAIQIRNVRDVDAKPREIIGLPETLTGRGPLIPTAPGSANLIWFSPCRRLSVSPCTEQHQVQPDQQPYLQLPWVGARARCRIVLKSEMCSLAAAVSCF